MSNASASIYLDKYRPKANGNCAVKIKVTHNRTRKYYPTKYELTPQEFERVIEGKRLSEKQNALKVKINSRLNKANEIIEALPIFTFNLFEKNYLEERNTTGSVFFEFDKYTAELRNKNRIGTAVSYECAKNSLKAFKKNLAFADVTADLLNDYESWMLKNGKSKTSVGIYVRSLRTIYNKQGIDKSLYPFGKANDGKYPIPKGSNKKKALTQSEVNSIFHFTEFENQTAEMARDIWIFLYLCNGMNVKDFCQLKWENINRNRLEYIRAKTERSNKEEKAITVVLQPEALAVIKKWGQKSIAKDAFVFPFLKPEYSAEKQRKVHQQLTKTINKYMKRIAKKLEIEKEVTTYVARHSFATILKRSGASAEMISELLGHSNLEVTQSYLDSFEDEQIEQQTSVLTAGFKKAN